MNAHKNINNKVHIHVHVHAHPYTVVNSFLSVKFQLLHSTCKKLQLHVYIVVCVNGNCIIWLSKVRVFHPCSFPHLTQYAKHKLIKLQGYPKPIVEVMQIAIFDVEN